MDNYNPIFGVKWPTPGTLGIAIVLTLLLCVLIIYMIYKYVEIKEQTRIHNYQHFIFQAKSKGLNNFQFKILKNMSLYLKLSNPKELVINPALFESTLPDFIEYLKRQTEGIDNIKDIFRDLIIIYEKLYMPESRRRPLKSMYDIEAGEILFFTLNEEVYLGKTIGRGRDFISIKLFFPDKILNLFEHDMNINLYLLRFADAEYLVHTVIMEIYENTLKVRISEDFTINREFRHPYIDVNIASVLTVMPAKDTTEPVMIECTILKINEHECVISISVPLEYYRDYSISFEISGFKFNVNAGMMSSKTDEMLHVNYITLKFKDLSDPGKQILSRYIAGNL